MKKKAIEKVPFLTLPKVKRGKRVECAALTAIREIGGEEHLFVEVYRNRKEQKEIPAVRVVLTEKDFGTYFPESGTWSRGRIKRNTWSDCGLIWQEKDEWIGKTVNIMVEENILYSPEDLERIREFLKGITVWNPKEWWEYIDRKQENIASKESREKESRKRQRRQQALKERGEQTPELPKERILNYADEYIFHNGHYLCYKKHGAKARVACSSCGGVTDARWKPGQSYESKFERMIEEPVMGIHGTCPMCGARGKYMPQGRVKSFQRERGCLFLGQKYKEAGMVFRYIEVEKEWQLEFACGEKGAEMYSSREKLSGIEAARIYFEPGKKIQKDYQKNNPYTGKNFWDDCNLSGLNNISIRGARIMPETYENMKGTFLQYSALKEYEKAAVEVNPADYLERYLETPQIEMLVKLNLIGVVKNLVRCRYGIVQCENARRPDEFLGIRKERVRLLMENQGDLVLLEVMQMEKRMGASWTEEQVRNLAELRTGRGQIELATQYMSLQKMLNRVAFYAGCEFGTKCSRAGERLRQTATTYFDYLHLREQLGYSLENSVYLYPRDLRAAHDKMVAESNEKEQEKRLEETAGRFPLIRKQYRRLRKKYFYEDEEYCIRPARSAEEIVLEGRFLHHCVGGDNYLRRHNDGERFILMLRSRKEPDIPYITVEIDREDCILQWYGANDKKPDKERMQSWIDAYTTRLKLGGSGRESEKEEIRILAAG